VLDQEVAVWPSTGGRRKTAGPRVCRKAAQVGRPDGQVQGFQARRERRVWWAKMGQEPRDAWASMGISIENSNWAAKANGPN
jgi:hypothetical protein